MWRIPLSNLNYDNSEIEAVRQVLETGWLTMGPLTLRFEEALAAYTGGQHAVAVANCTLALELVYRYVLEQAKADGRRGIIVPDITFVATANAVMSAGGEPVLCDVQSCTAPFLSLGKMEEILAARKDIAAVSLVHYAGVDYHTEAVAGLCARYGVALIEDCAHAAGGRIVSGKHLGTLGLAGCFSFFSNKNLSAGEGGMIITGDENLAQWLRLVRSHGVSAGTWDRHKAKDSSGYDVITAGTNARCTEITAALGLEQLKKLDAGNDARRRLTALYHDLLSDLPELKIVGGGLDASGAACHILSLVCENGYQRDRIRDIFNSNGVQTSHHYPPIHGFTFYQKRYNVTGDFAHATGFAERQITLPLHPKLSEEQVEEVTGLIRQAAR